MLVPRRWNAFTQTSSAHFGGICACGFLKIRETGLQVAQTWLRSSERNLTPQPKRDIAEFKRGFEDPNLVFKICYESSPSGGKGSKCCATTRTVTMLQQLWEPQSPNGASVPKTGSSQPSGTRHHHRRIPAPCRWCTPNESGCPVEITGIESNWYAFVSQHLAYRHISCCHW